MVRVPFNKNKKDKRETDTKKRKKKKIKDTKIRTHITNRTETKTRDQQYQPTQKAKRRISYERQKGNACHTSMKRETYIHKTLLSKVYLHHAPYY